MTCCPHEISLEIDPRVPESNYYANKLIIWSFILMILPFLEGLNIYLSSLLQLLISRIQEDIKDMSKSNEF